ncbi:TylF/MycF/NovP-related O-methyltransferase [Streptomyces sp. UNOC14_S4]|uniref:TylF/MycF/NovP-related O-methyltransferase n=1 Tax=Streptomyces sp. UNOC14_S4 TaxID=2872340 RepID=UPI001E4FEE00|nr:TylF/MycF/NovP-related O-methyltransferase [Streptomyces sp. UNOC14_S4]MCC3770432.1 TylF/MycF family methyltransferase [Streptomyces sp. UNOC14_S4]
MRTRERLGSWTGRTAAALPAWLPACFDALADPERRIAAEFLRDRGLGISPRQRRRLLRQHYLASRSLISPHTTGEILGFCRTILTVPPEVPGCVVEAGSYKGSSSAKFSIAASFAGRRLVVCDSFEGLPPFDEQHGLSITGRPVIFNEGDFAGSLDEVRANIAGFGVPDVCDYVPGWFEESLVSWREPIAAMYLDVDLAASTRACLRHLYPWVSPGGRVFSQDGHLPLVLEVFEDKRFWNDELGTDPPTITRMGGEKLISFTKS